MIWLFQGEQAQAVARVEMPPHPRKMEAAETVEITEAAIQVQNSMI